MTCHNCPGPNVPHHCRKVHGLAEQIAALASKSGRHSVLRPRQVVASGPKLANSHDKDGQIPVARKGWGKIDAKSTDTSSAHQEAESVVESSHVEAKTQDSTSNSASPALGALPAAKSTSRLSDATFPEPKAAPPRKNAASPSSFTQAKHTEKSTSVLLDTDPHVESTSPPPRVSQATLTALGAKSKAGMKWRPTLRHTSAEATQPKVTAKAPTVVENASTAASTEVRSDVSDAPKLEVAPIPVALTAETCFENLMRWLSDGKEQSSHGQAAESSHGDQNHRVNEIVEAAARGLSVMPCNVYPRAEDTEVVWATRSAQAEVIAVWLHDDANTSWKSEERQSELRRLLCRSTASDQSCADPSILLICQFGHSFFASICSFGDAAMSASRLGSGQSCMYYAIASPSAIVPVFLRSPGSTPSSSDCKLRPVLLARAD